MIHVVYNFAVGPMVWLAFTICITGLAYRLIRYRRKAVAAKKGLPGDFRTTWAVRSMLYYLLPLNRTAKSSPWSTVAGFALHIPLLVVAFFLSAHVIMLEQSWGVAWPTIPDVWADVLTIIALAALGFLALKRLLHPALRGLTEPKDLLVLLLVALPLLTGLAAHRQWGDYPLMLTLHVLSANILLMLIPFTKLSHMALFFVSRAATGSDFGKRQVGAW
ncbi:MAG: nitrate reductase [Desulfovibrionales bacterium]|nr:MAG: nitrate reductase [Desulfovibrionales bacterium]